MLHAEPRQGLRQPDGRHADCSGSDCLPRGLHCCLQDKHHSHLCGDVQVGIIMPQSDVGPWKYSCLDMFRSCSCSQRLHERVLIWPRRIHRNACSRECALRCSVTACFKCQQVIRLDRMNSRSVVSMEIVCMSLRAYRYMSFFRPLHRWSIPQVHALCKVELLVCFMRQAVEKCPTLMCHGFACS